MKSEILQIIIETNVDLEDIKEDLLNVTNCLEIIFKKAENLSVNIRHWLFKNMCIVCIKKSSFKIKRWLK